MKVLNIHELPDHLESITQNQWKRLFGLIPRIRKEQSFGEFTTNEQRDNETFSFPHYKSSAIEEDFTELVYEMNLVVNFDWIHWEEGRKLILEDHSDFSAFDLIKLCQLVTVMVRADRFNEGFLGSCFRDGVVLKVLEAMEKEVGVENR